MKIANVMTSKGRTRVTVSGQGWREDEEDCDIQELVTESEHIFFLTQDLQSDQESDCDARQAFSSDDP
jgi:hypothetical protein